MLLAVLAVAPAAYQSVVVTQSTVTVNGVAVATLKTRAVNGASPAARAQNFAMAINNLPVFADVNVRQADDTYAIFSGESKLLTITKAEAKAHGTTPGQLAATWARRLSSAFAAPAVKLDITDLRMPSPSNRLVPLKGYLRNEAVVASSAPEVASVRRVGDSIEVAANEPGTAEVTVTAGETTQSLLVTVQPYAAVLPQTLTVEVSGNPTLASTVQGAVEGTIRNQLKRMPGSTLSLPKISPESIPFGQSRTIVARVKVEANDAFDRTGPVNVIVRNTGTAQKRDLRLWYSNNPENVQRAGNLFGALLGRGEGARLLYHHINDSTVPLFLRVQVVNDSDRAAQIQVIPGDSAPDKNPVRAGIRAAEQYFRAWSVGSGEIITIPPRSSLPISLRRMGPQQTVSGLCGMRLIEGPDSVLVRADAWPPFNLESRWVPAIESSTPWRVVGCNPMNSYDEAPYQISVHVYPNPFKSAQFKYEVGGRYGFFKIGEKPISGSDAMRVLDGNFGVIYNIQAEISNPTSQSAEVEMVFEASAGYSGGLFLVNGVLSESPLLQPKAEYRIARFRLGAGESRKVDLVTIPLSGSSYPSLISVRPVQTLSGGISSRD